MGTDVAIVAITHNSAHVIDGLLDSVPAALDGLTADVVVVDNASTDGTVAKVRARSDCRLVVSPNIGYAGGLNLGVQSADQAANILVLNPDVRLHPGSIARLSRAMATPGVGITAPKVLNGDGTTHRSLRREPSIARAIGLNRTGLAVFSEYVSSDEAYQRAGRVDWALGAVLLISTECFRALGGWDSSYFLYSEEADFCLRARDLGYATLFEPTAIVRHIGGQSGQNEWTHTMQIVNKVRLYRRRHSLAASSLYYLVNILSEMSWAMRGNGSQSRAAVRALLFPRHRPPELGCSATIIPI